MFSRHSEKVSGQGAPVARAGGAGPGPAPVEQRGPMPEGPSVQAKGVIEVGGSAAKPPPLNGGGMTKSVIGRDLTIIGSGLKIVSKGLLQVDGEVQGDVIGLKVVIGPSGKVTGLVNAEEILVQGAVFGTIRAVEVKLAASSEVEGDLFHQSLALEQGAVFEGRSRRVDAREDLVPDLTNISNGEAD